MDTLQLCQKIRRYIEDAYELLDSAPIAAEMADEPDELVDLDARVDEVISILKELLDSLGGIEAQMQEANRAFRDFEPPE